MEIKLTEKDVRAIRALRAKKARPTAAEIAKKYDISKPYVYSIQSGRNRPLATSRK